MNKVGMKNANKELTNVLLLILVAVVWGAGFVFTPLALNSGASPALICLIRFGGATIFYGIFFRKKINIINKNEWKYGILCGGLMFGGFLLQTMGQLYTTPSSSALYTATCVVIVPFIAWILLKTKPTVKVIICALISLIGVVIISFKGSNLISFNNGDILTLLGAICYALQFIAIKFALTKITSHKLIFIQFLSAGIFFALYFLFAELPTLGFVDISLLWFPALFLTAFSSILAYTIQVHAQQFVSPSKASIILCMESAFGPLFSILAGFEPFTLSILFGGACIIFSCILLEINFKKKNPPLIETENISTDT